MLSILDVAERAMKGPKLDEKVWDLSLFKKMTELTKRHELKHPGDGSFFNLDDGLVERAFRAGVDFLVEQGVYCLSTNRVVQFTEKEVLDAIKEAPKQITVGEGRDARVLSQKKVEGNEPLNHWPAHHAPFGEDMAPLAVMNFARLPYVDYLQGFSFTKVDGREIYGVTMEAYAARRQLSWMREGIRKAGRPGMAIAYYPISLRGAALLAPMDPDYGLRRTDGVLLGMLPDVKIELDVLTAALILCQEYGCFNQCSGTTLMGGFCGGVEGAVIEGIAKPIAGWMCYKGCPSTTGLVHVLGPTGRKIVVRPELSWGTSVIHQALNTKTNIICSQGAGSAAAPGTYEHLIDRAMVAMRNAIDGANMAITRQIPPRPNAAQTPVEAAWQFDVTNATMAAGIKRAKAEGILRELAAEINGIPVEPGPDVRTVYDWVHHQPLPAYRDRYLRAKERLSNLGLQFAE